MHFLGLQIAECGLRNADGRACRRQIRNPKSPIRNQGQSQTRTMLVAGILALAGCAPAPTASSSGQGWRDTFPVAKANLVPTGRNPYLVLEPGYRLRYQSGRETLTISVLDQTKVVDGVETRVVEEREEQGGKLTEVSRNYYAIDKASNDLYYFGEDVDIYKDGKVVGHQGAWLSGAGGARFGLMLPGKARVGDRFYQEVAPKVAMDRAEVISVTEKLKVPAGTFSNCLHVRETSPLDSGAGDKWYAPGVGLIKDDEFELVWIEPAKK